MREVVITGFRQTGRTTRMVAMAVGAWLAGGDPVIWSSTMRDRDRLRLLVIDEMMAVGEREQAAIQAADRMLVARESTRGRQGPLFRKETTN